MTRFRRAIGPVAAAWLVFQIATLLCVPTALWAPSADTAQAACTCALGADGACPMHKAAAVVSSRPPSHAGGHSRPQAAAGWKLCLLRSAADSRVAVLSSLFGLVGAVPAPTALMVPRSTGTPTRLQRSPVFQRPLPPDPPPPRA